MSNAQHYDDAGPWMLNSMMRFYSIELQQEHSLLVTSL